VEDQIGKIIKNDSLSTKFARESNINALAALDELLENASSKNDGSKMFTDPEFISKVREQSSALIEHGSTVAKASIILPAGAWGLGHGLSAPDADISILGIGSHRYFIFHSAIGLAILRHFYRKWHKSGKDGLVKKASGALIGGLAVGVGLHLASDAFHPKAVIFPFFGSLVDGTLVDDNIWLLANSIWAFRIGYDVFALAIGDEISQVKKFVADKFWNYHNITAAQIVSRSD